MFNNESLLVKLWVKWIKKGDYTLEDVPEILNLKDEVKKILNR